MSAKIIGMTLLFATGFYAGMQAAQNEESFGPDWWIAVVVAIIGDILIFV